MQKVNWNHRSLFGIQKLVGLMIIGIGITDETLTNKDSLYKFVVGFNHETQGKYSEKDRVYLDQFSLWDERNEKAKELIEERTSDKGAIVTLLKNKFAYMWGDYDSSIDWSLNGLSPSPELVDFFYKGERVTYHINSNLLLHREPLYFILEATVEF